MNLKELQENWNKFGQRESLEAIVCPPHKAEKWQTDQFFTSGEEIIDELVRYIDSLGLQISGGVVVDFGCGAGRLTQALVPHSSICYGIDIAPAMIDLANKHNKYGDKCCYILHQTDDLSLFDDDSVDFICSIITLQNMEPRYSKKYIKEFIRILSSNGILIFQITSEPKTKLESFKQRLPGLVQTLFYKIKYRGRPRIQIFGLKKENVIELVEESGAVVMDVKPHSGGTWKWTSFQYCVIKAQT